MCDTPAGGHAPQPGGAPSRIERAWEVLDGVLDPEVPAVSVRDLGIVRDVRLAGESLDVVLTPTYSGCPATEVIEHDVLAAIEAAGLGPAYVTLQRAPAWTTDWITEQGRARLLAYGIAPPGPLPPGTEVPLRFMPRANAVAPALACPRCGSLQTERLSAFGSTACKALYRCLACREPFEHFKPL
ncbi:1,2-phenylacetyl-CoA epoxidase subunit PaaD [Acidovorax sp. 69]|uniref:1,2-phenylacetyl-CoA epoxidase subunit PaaD n=1 Tax=Acidovorax sp. 69 TaxID=2035202 RepID=UPI000C2432D9